MHKIGKAAAVGSLVLLAACGRSSPVDTAQVGGPDAPPGTRCANPSPASGMDASVTIDVPQDFDPSANPGPATKTFFTVLLPPRCPGETFPVVVFGHGLGEKRIARDELAADGSLQPDHGHNLAIRELAQALPWHGYVVVSADLRGNGESRPNAGGGYTRLMDPRAETADLRAILDWVFDHAGELAVRTEPASGIPRDFKLGTIGYSYGGGFQMTLAALDGRVDALVPNATWHEMRYSLIPGDGVRLGLGGGLCLGGPTGLVTPTPLLEAVCNAIGITNPLDSTIRTRADLVSWLSGPQANPRTVNEPELDEFLHLHSMDYFEARQAAGQPWGYGEAQARLRPVPALFMQGNRDNLFNLNEAWWNARYFAAAGADVRLLSTEGGHLLPTAGQGADGPANCGGVTGVSAALAWFDRHLKGIGSAEFDAIPEVCISVADTQNAPDVPLVGVELSSYPVGSLSGAGAVPARLATLAAAVTPADVSGVFVPVLRIAGGNKVIAGSPRLAKITVTPGTGATQAAIAFVGVGIRRGGQTILVDDQVTPFVEGAHDHNRNLEHPGELLLPGVGEQLQDGDEVGLLFFHQHPQFAGLISPGNALALDSAVPSIIGLIAAGNAPPATPDVPVLSALDPLSGVLTVPNPYNVAAEGVELPIRLPGTYPGSRLNRR